MSCRDQSYAMPISVQQADRPQLDTMFGAENGSFSMPPIQPGTDKLPKSAMSMERMGKTMLPRMGP